jgi:hypothetical protein
MEGGWPERRPEVMTGMLASRLDLASDKPRQWRRLDRSSPFQKMAVAREVFGQPVGLPQTMITQYNMT